MVPSRVPLSVASEGQRSVLSSHSRLFSFLSSAHFGGRAPVGAKSNSFFSRQNTIHTSCRWVQYTQTSQTMNTLNGDRRVRETGVKWVTRSTKEYMKEGDLNQDHVPLSLQADLRNKGKKRSTLEHRERYREVRGSAEARVEQELVRIRDEKGLRWKKSFSFFKRQGKAFVFFYIIAYAGTLSLLYLGFASGVLKKEAAFEYLLFFLGHYIDREWFYERVEAWEGKINFGFAFVINEFLEMLRFPLVMFVFYQLRPLIGRTHRGMRKSIFRMNAAES